MLVLARHVGERIIIGDPPNQIVVMLVSVKSADTARIGIEAPQGVRVDREEVRKRIDAEGPKKQSLVDLGWENGWTKVPAAVQECKKLGHVTSDVDLSGRGVEHVVTCRECRYVFRYDSSD